MQQIKLTAVRNSAVEVLQKFLDDKLLVTVNIETLNQSPDLEVFTRQKSFKQLNTKTQRSTLHLNSVLLDPDNFNIELKQVAEKIGRPGHFLDPR